MTKIKNSHSSFWTGNYFDSFEGLDRNDPQRIYKLSQGKRSIANFVNIATGKRIPVVFNSRGDSYTDGRTVTIGSEITSPSDFDVAVGLALHEASHIAHTDFGVLPNLSTYIGNKLYEKGSELGLGSWKVDGIVKNILNVVEDRRLDSLSYGSAPGYREYYVKMYDKYFNNKVVDKALLSKEYTSEDIDSYMFRIINIHNPNTRLNALKGLSEIWKLIDLKNIDRLKNTEDAMEVSLLIFETILKYIEVEQMGDEQPQPDSEKQDEESQGGSGSGSDENQQSEDDEKSGDDSENQGGSSTQGSGEGEGDSTETNPNENLPELSNHMKRQLDNAIKKQKDFLSGDVKKKQLTKTDSKQIDIFEKSNSEIRSASGEFTYDGSPVDVYVVNKVTRDTTSASPVILQDWNTKYAYNKEVTEGISKGRMLAKKLQIRSESRNTVYNRQKSGKIDKRMISSLGFGNTNVFSFNEIDEYKNANLHISLDASSSMNGKKWENSIVTITTICTAVTLIEGLDVQVTLRTGANFSGKAFPYIVKVFDSREDGLDKIKWLFPRLQATGTTPEGLCFEAIQKDFISKSSKLDSYFVNISDGMPYFMGSNSIGRGVTYGDQPAINHTKKQVKKITDSGIEVLSYFVSERELDPNSWQAKPFVEMYGKNSKFVDITSVNHISKTMNELFLRKSA